MIKLKKLIPEVYSQSFDMSIFLAVLDLVYTARELDILRARNSHLPTKCFEEDLPRLSSLFGLGDKATRDLLSEYRLLVKQKGTRDVVFAIAQFVTEKVVSPELSVLRVITETEYEPPQNKESGTVITSIKEITEKENVVKLGKNEAVEEVLETIWTKVSEPAENNARATNALANALNKAKAAEVVNDDGTITKYIVEDDATRAITATKAGTPLTVDTFRIWKKSIVNGNLVITGSKPHLPTERVKKLVTTLELYSDFTSLNSDLFELLVSKLAPIGVHFVVKPIEELEKLVVNNS